MTTKGGYLTNQREHGAPPPDWRCCSVVGSWQQGSPCGSQAGSQPINKEWWTKVVDELMPCKWLIDNSRCWDYLPLSWNAMWSEGCWSHWAQAGWRREHNDSPRCLAHSTALHRGLGEDTGHEIVAKGKMLRSIYWIFCKFRRKTSIL